MIKLLRKKIIVEGQCQEKDSSQLLMVVLRWRAKQQLHLQFKLLKPQKEKVKGD
jgi:hypothetical protein